MNSLQNWFLFYQEMADRPPPGQVTCPLCDKVCTIPAEGSDSLPNNLHALHMVELKNELTKRNNTITECTSIISERNKTITKHENTITERDNTITTLSSTNLKLNSFLENGQ